MKEHHFVFHSEFAPAVRSAEIAPNPGCAAKSLSSSGFADRLIEPYEEYPRKPAAHVTVQSLMCKKIVTARSPRDHFCGWFQAV
jgi:hypothetical protein